MGILLHMSISTNTMMPRMMMECNMQERKGHQGARLLGCKSALEAYSPKYGVCSLSKLLLR